MSHKSRRQRHTLSNPQPVTHLGLCILAFDLDTGPQLEVGDLLVCLPLRLQALLALSDGALLDGGILGDSRGKPQER